MTAISGTRALIAEECFDALLGLLIESKLVSKPRAGVMCELLAQRLQLLASGQVQSSWQIDGSELKHQAVRLSAMAQMLQTKPPGHFSRTGQ